MNTNISFYEPNYPQRTNESLWMNKITNNIRIFKFPYAYRDLMNLKKYINFTNPIDLSSQVIYIKNKNESVIFIPIDFVYNNVDISGIILNKIEYWEIEPGTIIFDKHYCMTNYFWEKNYNVLKNSGLLYYYSSEPKMVLVPMSLVGDIEVEPLLIIDESVISEHTI